MNFKLVLDRRPATRGWAPGAALTARLTGFYFWTFVGLTAMAVFIPLNPAMPRAGIDPSYAFAMNQAVALHMSFGKQIVFTYGPYASVITRTYSPATDVRMLCGGFFLGICYLVGLLYLVEPQRRYLVVLLLLFLATFGPGELLLLSYPLLLVLCVVKYCGRGPWEGASLRHLAPVAAVMWSTLGLLPVVKGSLLLPFATAVTFAPLLLLLRKRLREALLVAATPIAATLSLWLAAGQTLHDIPPFLHGISLLTSGFTEAMSLPWAVIPRMAGNSIVAAFLCGAVLMLASMARMPWLGRVERAIVCLVCVIFLLVAFKHGFVAPTNVTTSFASLAVFLLLLGSLRIDRPWMWSLATAVLLTAATAIIRDPQLVKEVHLRFGGGTMSAGRQERGDIEAYIVRRAAAGYTRVTYKNTWNTYRSAWQGLLLRLRFDGSLGVMYAAATADMRKEFPLIALKGTADIYNYDQSVLLASGNEWSPRPVIQSYTAYSPELAGLDEQHLRGSKAPDWIWFNLQTIDGRLPSMDDGLSWPALLDNYTYISYDGRVALFQKRDEVCAGSRFDEVSTGVYSTNTPVAITNKTGLWFAQIDWEPTLAGKLLTQVMNAPELQMGITLADGSHRSFRVVANMMKTNILLSPLIETTEEFASLMARDKPAGIPVRTIVLTPTYGGSRFWSSTYTLTLKQYVPQSACGGGPTSRLASLASGRNSGTKFER